MGRRNPALTGLEDLALRRPIATSNPSQRTPFGTSASTLGGILRAAGQVLPERCAAYWPDDASDQAGAVCPDDGDSGPEYAQRAGDRFGIGVLDAH